MDRASFASITSSEGGENLPKRMLYQPGGVDEQSEANRISIDDTHSELDVDLYDEEVATIGGVNGANDGGDLQLEHLSLASDDFSSILNANTMSSSVDTDEIIPGIPSYLHNPSLANSFVSVGGESEMMERSQIRLNRSQQGSAQMQQGPPRPQIRLYDDPGLSMGLPQIPTSQHYRAQQGMRIIGDQSMDGTGSTISSIPSSQRYGRSYMHPGRPEPMIRTDFTAAANAGTEVGTPKDDAYEILGTPPGDPPSSRAPDRGDVPGLVTPATTYELPLPRNMQPCWLLVLMALGFTAGSVALQSDPPGEIGYWLNEIGTLYTRVLNCVTVPMAFCQVVFSVSTLTSKHTLHRLWFKTLGLFLVVCCLSALVSIAAAYALRPALQQQAALGLSLTYPTFAFQCDNNKLLELHADDKSLRCTGAVATAVTSSEFVAPSNATFPRIVDLQSALGLPVSVATVDYTQYVFTLVQMYFPNNIVVTLSDDLYLSTMVIATVLGVAVTRSFRGLQSRSNPLLRLFVHLYAALFTVLEWLQTLALFACIPMTAGSILVAPDSPAYMKLAGYYCLACVLVAAIECLVVCPLVFYLFTKRNPFGWLYKVLAPVLLSVMLQSPLLPMGAATRVVMRTKEVPPPVFGAVFPMLSAMNRIAQALGLPLGLAFVAAVNDCDALDHVDARTAFMLFGFVIVACFGETALAKSQMAYFLTAWRILCHTDEYDTPAAVLAIAGISLIIFRLGALANFITNIMIVRMAASTEEGRLHAEQHLQ